MRLCFLLKKDKSIDSFKKALENGLLNLLPMEAIKNDSDLEYIRDDPRYEKLVEQYSKK